nr:uncharacterized protein LOC117278646 [Nicotiana tomentosiformis]
MNGAVEAANKNIKRILRKIVDNHRKWHEKLSFALLSYQTTMRTSTGATPYMLVYGTEIVISPEIKIPSLRVIQEANLDDAEWIQVRQEQLMIIDEKRMDAVCHAQLYQNRMDNAFNKRVKPRQFIPGQLLTGMITFFKSETPIVRRYFTFQCNFSQQAEMHSTLQVNYSHRAEILPTREDLML